ncbi:hypothetical protein FACS1894190_17540 [Spirochaetia bacterium]|nr:hypothetical protein FACS1894190_17540 [Spirochaetia bacterium]
MKNNIVGGVTILMGLLIVLGPQFLFKACGLMEGNIPRCHWSVQADTGIGMIIILLGVCFIVFNNQLIQFGLTIGIFFASIFALSVPNILIGGCGMMSMACRRTAFPALSVISILVLVGAAANIVYLGGKTKTAM